MRAGWVLGMWLAGVFCAPGQERTVSVEDLLGAGEEWMQENVDEEALRALTGLEQKEVQAFFRDVQQRLGGEYVLELAPLKAAANAVVPILESYEETEPYAAWIKARLDYFEAAERLGRSGGSSNAAPGQVTRAGPNPAAKLQRRVWVEMYEQRPAPRGAGQYIGRLKPIFAAEKVPPELVWLAEVESAFDAGARSPAGAAGLYQLMPTAARRAGLAVAPKDERLAPEKNARAAARYLRYLYLRFGDWPLALAAYNAGEGKVGKLLERYQARTFDRIATYLPAETQMYVPKVEAALRRREGISLAKLKPPTG